MSKKTEFILESIIRAYLSEQSPIGSMLLQDSLNVPASTIRVYFKQLDNDGFVSKQHVSGGRIPTIKAMKHYWNDYFNSIANDVLNINDELQLLRILHDNELFCIIIDNKDMILDEIINVSNQYIILKFNGISVLNKYSDELFLLFTQLRGYELKNIKLILNKLNLVDPLVQISRACEDTKLFLYGEKIFSNIVKLNSFSPILNNNLFDYFNKQLVYEELFLPENMGVKLPCKFYNNDSKMIIAGSIYTDYENVVKELKEVV